MNKKLERALRRVLSQRKGVLVVGGGSAVSELFLRKALRLSVKSGWLTYETPAWHIHARLADLKRMRFIEQPSTCLKGKMSYHVAFEDQGGRPVLRVYFNRNLRAYHRLKTQFLKLG